MWVTEEYPFLETEDDVAKEKIKYEECETE